MLLLSTTASLAQSPRWQSLQLDFFVALAMPKDFSKEATMEEVFLEGNIGDEFFSASASSIEAMYTPSPAIESEDDLKGLYDLTLGNMSQEGAKVVEKHWTTLAGLITCDFVQDLFTEEGTFRMDGRFLYLNGKFYQFFWTYTGGLEGDLIPMENRDRFFRSISVDRNLPAIQLVPTFSQEDPKEKEEKERNSTIIVIAIFAAIAIVAVFFNAWERRRGEERLRNEGRGRNHDVTS